MALNLFKKSGKKSKDKDKSKEQATAEEKNVQVVPNVSDTSIQGEWSSSGQGVLRAFYVSEKASLVNSANQYIFRVGMKSNKPEIKKQVERTFNVKVKDVRVLNMPKKRRDIGRHPGFKGGFRKAIVVLEKGYSIEQAKA